MSTTPDAPPLSALIATVPQRHMTVEQTVQVVQEQVVIRPQAAPNTTHLAIAPQAWEWEQLRDYVVGEIEKVVGVFPRDPMKERGIFSAFITRWGTRSSEIARYAFEVAGGYWKNAPISVNRFCKASDEYFAAVIIEHLDKAAAARAAFV